MTYYVHIDGAAIEKALAQKPDSEPLKAVVDSIKEAGFRPRKRQGLMFKQHLVLRGTADEAIIAKVEKLANVKSVSIPGAV
jgi:hypothetical protein